MTTINIRVTKTEKAALAKIASDAGISLSAFLRSAAVIEARNVLSKHKSRLVDGEAAP